MFAEDKGIFYYLIVFIQAAGLLAMHTTGPFLKSLPQ